MISFPVQYPQDRVFRNRVVQETQAKKFFPPAAIGRNSQSTIKESIMNWDRIEGNWKQLKGSDNCADIIRLSTTTIGKERSP